MDTQVSKKRRISQSLVPIVRAITLSTSAKKRIESYKSSSSLPIFIESIWKIILQFLDKDALALFQRSCGPIFDKFIIKNQIWRPFVIERIQSILQKKEHRENWLNLFENRQCPVPIGIELDDFWRQTQETFYICNSDK